MYNNLKVKINTEYGSTAKKDMEKTLKAVDANLSIDERICAVNHLDIVFKKIMVVYERFLKREPKAGEGSKEELIQFADAVLGILTKESAVLYEEIDALKAQEDTGDLERFKDMLMSAIKEALAEKSKNITNAYDRLWRKLLEA